MLCALLILQFKICIDKGFPEAEDGQQRALLSQSYSGLADLLLDGYRDQITSLSQSDATLARGAEVQSAFANHRDQIISPLSKFPFVSSLYDLIFFCLCSFCCKGQTRSPPLVSCSTGRPWTAQGT